MTDVAVLKTKVNGAFAWLTLLTVAFGVAFLFVMSDLSTVKKDASDIRASVASLTTTTSAMQGSLERIEDKLDDSDDKPKASTKRKPPR